MSLGFIVSDSLDHSAREVRAAAQRLDGDPFAGVLVLQRDYGYSQVLCSINPQASLALVIHFEPLHIVNTR